MTVFKSLNFPRLHRLVLLQRVQHGGVHPGDDREPLLHVLAHHGGVREAGLQEEQDRARPKLQHQGGVAAHLVARAAAGESGGGQFLK